MESDERFYDNWTEMYENSTNSPASDDDISRAESRLNEMNERVHILYEPVIHAVHVILPKYVHRKNLKNPRTTPNPMNYTIFPCQGFDIYN